MKNVGTFSSSGDIPRYQDVTYPGLVGVQVSYDPAISGLTAVNVQEAIDQLSAVGNQGYQGWQGEGVQGFQGITGPQGWQGDIGYQGKQGLAGLDFSTTLSAYGVIYGDYIGSSQGFAVQNQWYTLTTPRVAGLNNDVTVNTGSYSLTVNRPGKYIVDYSVGTEKTDVKDYELSAFKNGNVIPDSVQSSKWTTEGSNYYTVGCPSIVDLTAGDVITLRGRCTTDASGAMTVRNATLRISQIDAIGPQGWQGTNPGPTGLQGYQGDLGFQGITGPQGWQGITGYQGWQGEGVQGPQGVMGTQGWQGEGVQGFQGITGTQGWQGEIGYQGWQGEIGSQGWQGTNPGPTGLQGYQGYGGGPTGVDGFQGCQGWQGTNPGPTGLQGYQGWQGVGFQGSQGSTGPIGASDTQVLFNNSGSVDGSDNLTWNNSGSILGVQGILRANSFETPLGLTSITGAASPYLMGVIFTLKCDATAANITVNLPDAATCKGRIYCIKKIDSTANTVTIDGNGGQTIDGDTTVVISKQWTNLMIQSDGDNWIIL